MSESGVSEFGGVMGGVLRGALGGRTLITGFVLGLVLLVGTWVCGLLNSEELATPFAQIVIAVALARFAVNGLYGEWAGTVFSSAGGPWPQVGIVAARYLALNAIWIFPLLLFGLKPEAAGQEIVAMATGQPSGHALELLMLYATGMMIAPPVFLIAAVGAERFTDLVSPAHWKRLFGGRLGDLFAIYTVYLGAMAALTIVSIPLGIAIAVNSLKLALFAGGVFLAFLTGLGVTLLGRLSGFFAFGETPPEARPGHEPASWAPESGRPLSDRPSSGFPSSGEWDRLPSASFRQSARGADTTTPPGLSGHRPGATHPPGLAGRASGATGAIHSSGHIGGGSGATHPPGHNRRVTDAAHALGQEARWPHATIPPGHSRISAGVDAASGRASGGHSGTAGFQSRAAESGNTGLRSNGSSSGQPLGQPGVTGFDGLHSQAGASARAYDEHPSGGVGIELTGQHHPNQGSSQHAPSGQSAGGHPGHRTRSALAGLNGSTHTRPPLLDGSERVGVARARHDVDPGAAMRLLEELREEFAPSPHVLHALCLMRVDAAQIGPAVELAREALPLCFQRGHLVFAAEIIRALWEEVDQLGIGREHALVVAATLRKAGDLHTACSLYKRVLGTDRGEPRAIKGLMHSADAMVENVRTLAEAVQIYEFLLATCKSSRLFEDMRRGHEEARRRHARMHEPALASH